MTDREPQKPEDPVADASRLAAERDAMRRKDAEPSLGKRLGQIGVLGWAIVLPALACLFLGRWLDRTYSSGVFFSAPGHDRRWRRLLARLEMDVATVIAALPSLALQVALGAAVGAAAGFAYFRALRWNVDLFERGATPIALLLLVTRFGLLAALFFALAKLGAPALLSAALGLLAARRVTLRRLGGLK